MEKISNNIINKIEEEINPETIKEKLLGLQFKYIKNIEDGKIQKIGDKRPSSLEDMIFQYTGLSDYIYNEFEKRGDFTGEDLVKFRKSVIDEIENLYKNNSANLVKNVKDLINKRLDEMGPIKPEKILDEKRKKQTGLLNYNTGEIFRSRNVKYEKLEKLGFSKYDNYTEIHLDNLYDQKNKNEAIKNIFSGDSLSKLAINIVEKSPETRLILANSWLVDNAVIRERVGLTVYDKVDHPTDNTGFWGQFITQDGKINEKRANKFLETGVPEFYLAKGYISVEDFLKLYLPKEKKGVVHLKELSPVYVKNEDEMRVAIFDRWDDVTVDEIDNFFDKNKFFKRFIDTEKGKEFLDYLKEAKEKNASPRYLDKEKFSDLNYHINKFFSKDRFIAKDVFIE